MHHGFTGLVHKRDRYPIDSTCNFISVGEIGQALSYVLHFLQLIALDIQHSYIYPVFIIVFNMYVPLLSLRI